MFSKSVSTMVLIGLFSAGSVFANAEMEKMVVVEPPGLSITETAPPIPFSYSGVKYDLKATGKTLNEGPYKDCSVDVYYWVDGYYSRYSGYVSGYYSYRYTHYYPSSFECEGSRTINQGDIKYVPRNVKTLYRKSSPEMKSASTLLTLSQFTKSMEACAKEQGNALNAALATDDGLKKLTETLQFKTVSIVVVSDSTKGESGISMKAKIDGSKAPELSIVAIAKDEKGCKEKISQSALTELLRKWSDRK